MELAFHARGFLSSAAPPLCSFLCLISVYLPFHLYVIQKLSTTICTVDTDMKGPPWEPRAIKGSGVACACFACYQDLYLPRLPTFRLKCFTNFSECETESETCNATLNQNFTCSVIKSASSRHKKSSIYIDLSVCLSVCLPSV